MIRLIGRAAQDTFSYPRVAVWTLIAVGASVMGPFGTYVSADWLTRSIYWFTICGCSVFLSQLVRGIVGHYIPDNASWRFDLAAIAAMSFVLTPFVWGLTRFMLSQAGTAPSAPFWRIFLFVLLVATLVTSMRRIHRFHQMTEEGRGDAASIFMEPQSDGTAQPDGAADPMAPARQEIRLYQRLPAEIREPILHLSARDHFVDVETETGLYSLRMRFADAVAEMDGVEGHITHRSHWIAADAIREPKRAGGKQYLVLRNGTEVPVSRTFRPQLEAAGAL